MTPKEKMTNKELLAANETLAARVRELEEKLASVQSAPAPAAPSKSRVQAEKGLELLKQGPVTTAMLKGVNERYPSDVIYYVRTVLKQKVLTNRTKEGTTYTLPTEPEQKPTEAPAEKA